MPKVVLVTGAARGIGRAIAQNFAADHDVAITWLTTPPIDFGENVLTIPADLTEPTAPAQIIAAVLDRFGRIDVIVNNAGRVSDTPDDPSDTTALMQMLQVNLLAADALLAVALPHLKPGAAVVSVSSVNAVLPPKGAAIYGASKAALNLWTKGMAKELGPRNIRVNAVAPGAVHIPEEPRPDDLIRLFTDLTALGRLPSPGDIAAAVRFLASDHAASITGEILTVSGGYRL
jgi:3-oxoacyl-[acyl-carrier protein] reductase